MVKNARVEIACPAHHLRVPEWDVKHWEEVAIGGTRVALNRDLHRARRSDRHHRRIHRFVGPLRARGRREGPARSVRRRAPTRSQGSPASQLATE
jgi:hypothetical protein